MKTLEGPIKTYGGVAEEIGTNYRCVSDLVELLGLEPKHVPHTPNGKGLDRFDVGILTKTIDYGRRLVAAAS